jgi:flagellar hook assembly protein FlgD
MNVSSMLSANNALAQTPTTTPTPTPSSGSTGSSAGASSSDPGGISSLATQGTFITLLVAQLANQDPLNPTDSTTFVTQLAQFTQVDQMVGIAQNVQTITNDLGAGTTPPSSTTPTTTP